MADTLLLADDSLTMRRVVELTFAEQGLNVVSVADGQQAIEYLAAGCPSLALISVSLQKVNGFDVARFVRDHPEKRVPVLLLAGAFDNLDHAQVRESGAAGVLVKPFEPSVVIKRVKELLGMKPATTAADAGAPSRSDSGRLLTTTGGPVRAADAVAAAPPAAVPDGLNATAWPSRAADAPGPQAHHEGVQSARRAGDYFDQLDAAFESLDAQIAARAAAPAREPQATNPDPLGPLSQSAPVADVHPGSTTEADTPSPDGLAEHNPVFEIDNDWFANKPAPETTNVTEFVVTRASDFASPGGSSHEHDRSWAPTGQTEHETMAASLEEMPMPAVTESGGSADTDVSSEVPEAPADAPASGAPIVPATYAAATPPTPAIAPADAFAMLWAQEQGEVVLAPAPPPPLELADQTVDTLSGQVSQRVTAVLVEGLTAQVNGLAPRIANDVADRLAPLVADRLVGALGDRLAADLAPRVADLIAERALQGVLGDALRQTVNEVSERLVRAEIERIRAAAQTLRQ